MNKTWLSKRPCRNPDIIWKREGNKVFLFDPETGDILTLNITGARIWELSDGKHMLMEIVTALHKEFRNAPEGRVKKGLQRFMNELTKRRLVT